MLAVFLCGVGMSFLCVAYWVVRENHGSPDSVGIIGIIVFFAAFLFLVAYRRSSI